MTGYIALLRGIDVGGRNTVRMADLRSLLNGLGYTDAAALLQSGNAAFTARGAGPAEIGSAIEDALRRELGVSAAVVVRTAADLQRVVDALPFAVRDPAKCAVAFLSAPVDRDRLAALDPSRYAPEELVPGERELYLYLPHGLGRARLTPLLERHAPAPATVRNWNTVTRLLEAAGGRSA
ncbi:DUF1697 domain-containing protein [Streptomonospora salina]|uniref:Uncharacterized protein (DUF1697 family) n=1 Tax=Streptomonospora salina TaxID=104205 RepID=A0A841EHZ5_9ACTN|nr:DUF1697 domain-containing protein [Streptomonospora salina]MBB6000999.1 uncharacterized protein (DUF1697 family) [Streptomonospora salina]